MEVPKAVSSRSVSRLKVDVNEIERVMGAAVPSFETESQDPAICMVGESNVYHSIAGEQAPVDKGDCACLAVLLVVVEEDVVRELGVERGAVMVVEPSLLKADYKGYRSIVGKCVDNVFMPTSSGILIGRVSGERAEVGSNARWVRDPGVRRRHWR